MGPQTFQLVGFDFRVASLATPFVIGHRVVRASSNLLSSGLVLAWLSFATVQPSPTPTA